MPFGLGMPELIIIGGVMLLIFGPSQLPKLGKGLGDTFREFRKVGKDIEKGMNAPITEDDEDRA